MDLPINSFKRAILAGRQQTGLWISLPSHVTVEIAAGAGFDWIMIDTEHSANELPMVYGQLQAAAAGGLSHPVVRLPCNDEVIIKRFLDAGVQSLLLPMVETKEEAERAVMATRYPPQGVRGAAALSRASRFGRVDHYHMHAHEELCVLVQVESKLGLENLDAIASVSGIDGIFIGPSDLSASLGYLGQPKHPDVVKIIQGALKRIRTLGKAAGILSSDEALTRSYIEAGSVFTAVGSDLGILVRGVDALAAQFSS